MVCVSVHVLGQIAVSEFNILRNNRIKLASFVLRAASWHQRRIMAMSMSAAPTIRHVQILARRISCLFNIGSISSTAFFAIFCRRAVLVKGGAAWTVGCDRIYRSLVRILLSELLLQLPLTFLREVLFSGWLTIGSKFSRGSSLICLTCKSIWRSTSGRFSRISSPCRFSCRNISIWITLRHRKIRLCKATFRCSIHLCFLFWFL